MCPGDRSVAAAGSRPPAWRPVRSRRWTSPAAFRAPTQTRKTQITDRMCPAPTVRPPSRRANRIPASNATYLSSSNRIAPWPPGSSSGAQSRVESIPSRCTTPDTPQQQTHVLARLCLGLVAPKGLNARDDDNARGSVIAPQPDHLDALLQSRDTTLHASGTHRSAARDRKHVFDRHHEAALSVSHRVWNRRVELDELQQLWVGDVHLVHEDDDVCEPELAREQNVLVCLRLWASRSVHEQDRTVHLRSSGHHVLDVVRVSRAVDVRVVSSARLVLDVRHVDGDAALALFGRAIDLCERYTSAAVQPGHREREGRRERGLAVVDMPDGSYVDVDLVHDSNSGVCSPTPLVIGLSAPSAHGDRSETGVPSLMSRRDAVRRETQHDEQSRGAVTARRVRATTSRDSSTSRSSSVNPGRGPSRSPRGGVGRRVELRPCGGSRRRGPACAGSAHRCRVSRRQSDGPARGSPRAPDGIDRGQSCAQVRAGVAGWLCSRRRLTRSELPAAAASPGRVEVA